MTWKIAEWPIDAAWSKRFGSAADEDAVALDVDAQGNIVFAGTFSTTLDFGGGAVTSQGGSDLFVTKLASNGNHVWSKRFGNAQNQAAADLDVSPSGDVVVTGGFEGSIDFGTGALNAAGATDLFVAKLDATGSGLWAKRFGANGTTIAAASVQSVVGGGLIFGGAVTGTLDFGTGALAAGGLADAFVVRLDASGAPEWVRRYGAGGNQHARALGAQPNGDVLVGGYFENTMAVDAFVLTSGGGFDAWVARMGL